MPLAELTSAIEVFANAFAFTRSFSFPAETKAIKGLWVICDQERKKATDYRREEWVALDTAPAKVDAIARKHARGHFCICAIRPIDKPDDALRTGYRALGYRLNATETLMVHRLKPISKSTAPFPVARVDTQALADRVNKAAGRKQILRDHLGRDTPLRLYAALDGENPIGWVRSLPVGDASWVSNMYVIPKYRRKGIGKSILGKMLKDDRRLGSERSVLLASHTGELLYNRMGYQAIGQLLVYTPARRS
jgi:GNAT superfamily N-acetyltransferase